MPEKTIFKTFEHFKEPIAVVNSSGVIVFFNSEFHKIFGITKKNNKLIADIFTDKDPYTFKNILKFLENRAEYNNSFILNTELKKHTKFYLTATRIGTDYLFIFYTTGRISLNENFTDLISKITSSFDLDEVLEKAVSALSRLFTFSGYNICILDDEKNVLRSLKLSLPGISKESLQLYRNSKYPMNETGGVISKAIIKREVVYIPDRDTMECIGMEERVSHDLMLAFGVKSLITFPMVMENTPVGVIAFYATGDKRLILGDDDIEEIREFICPITIAINNAVLHNKVLRQTVELEQIIAKRTEETRKKGEILEKLNIITKKINYSLDLDEVLDVTISELKNLFYFEGFAILLIDENKEYLITLKLVIPGFTDEQIKKMAAKKIPLNLIEGGGVAFAVMQKKEMYFEDVDPDKLANDVNKEAVVRTGGIRSALIMPLMINQEVVGAMIMSCYHQNLGFTEEDIETIRRFVEQISSAIKNSFLHRDLKDALSELEKANRKLEKQKKLLEELSITDSLTGIRNRRYFDERIVEEFEKCRRYGKTVYILMIDIDNFKTVNDNYGHDYGDHVLIKFTEILQETLRKSDLLARYGGEEFIVAMFETNIEGAKMVTEKIRKRAEENVYLYKNIEIKRTVSIGLSCFPSPVCPQESIEYIIKEADEALYIAKNTGKNRWVYYYDSDENPKSNSSELAEETKKKRTRKKSTGDTKK